MDGERGANVARKDGAVANKLKSLVSAAVEAQQVRDSLRREQESIEQAAEREKVRTGFINRLEEKLGDTFRAMDGEVFVDRDKFFSFVWQPRLEFTYCDYTFVLTYELCDDADPAFRVACNGCTEDAYCDSHSVLLAINELHRRVAAEELAKAEPVGVIRSRVKVVEQDADSNGA